MLRCCHVYTFLRSQVCHISNVQLTFDLTSHYPTKPSWSFVQKTFHPFSLKKPTVQWSPIAATIPDTSVSQGSVRIHTYPSYNNIALTHTRSPHPTIAATPHEMPCHTNCQTREPLYLSYGFQTVWAESSSDAKYFAGQFKVIIGHPG